MDECGRYYASEESECHWCWIKHKNPKHPGMSLRRHLAFHCEYYQMYVECPGHRNCHKCGTLFKTQRELEDHTFSYIRSNQ